MQHHLRQHASTICSFGNVMFDKEYFLHGLAMQVAEYHNSAYVDCLRTAAAIILCGTWSKARKVPSA